MQRGRMNELGFFGQDSWRIKPGLTLNFGVRWELQLPFYPLNDSYSTATIADVWGVTGVSPDFKPGAIGPENKAQWGYLFQPGVLNGQLPTFQQFKKGTKAYNIDWDNLAPNVGIAWQPALEGGWLQKVFSSEPVFRAGFSTAYSRHGMSDFSGVFGANPGVTITTDRSLALGNLGTLPLLFRDPSRLGAPSFSKTPQFPMTDVVTQDVNIFDPNLQVPFARSWTAGVQRALGRQMAVEARYVGTRYYDGWTEYDYNELNIVENGFLNEFKLAQQNLRANLAAGRGANFRYYGPGTGTSPLPIFLAYFGGFSATQAGDPSRYTSGNFASTTFVNPLAIYNPDPFGAANALDADATRRANALRAGLPANFLVANPDLLGGANVTANGGYTRYNSLQLELRRRLHQGLQFQTSYVYGRSYTSERYSFRKDRKPVRQSGVEGGVTHSFKANWLYELPIGRGRRFGSGMDPWLDGFIGGWMFHGTGRIQSGRLLDFGNVRLVNMTEKDLAKMFKLRFDDAGMKIWMLPQDVLDNTVKAFGVSASSLTGYGPLGPPDPNGRYIAPANSLDCAEVAPGYGDCGANNVIVTGPTYVRFDFAIAKQVPIKGRVNFEVRAEMLNAFNKTNFTPVTGMSTDANPNVTSGDSFEVTTGESGRIIQLVFRINF